MSLGHNDMSGAGKAAVILSVLGEELAAEVVRRLAPYDRELVSAALVKDSTVPDEAATELVGQFLADVARLGKVTGGVEYARRVLNRAVGTQAAKGVMTRLEAVEVIANAPIERLTRLIKGEHPQAAALVVSQLEPGCASTLLEALEPGLRVDIAARAGKISNPSTAALCDIAVLVKKMQAGE